MKRIILLASLAFSINAFAQVPPYVPTNGLQGWWPFSGNANDVSGNNNNGTVNGATLVSDRNGNIASAFDFNGQGDYISVSDNSHLRFSSHTISLWYYRYGNPLVQTGVCGNTGIEFLISKGQDIANNAITISQSNDYGQIYQIPPTQVAENYSLGAWNNIICTYDSISSSAKLYLNGILTSSMNNVSWNCFSNISNLTFGVHSEFINTTCTFYYKGMLDDIGIWNRALTQQEITDLFNAVNCANNTTITPQTNSIVTGNAASFTATTSDPNPNYVWQSDLGQGFQTLNNFGNYSGVNTASLNIANVQLSEHNQPIRVISTSGNCIDTSNVAVINIMDTCITNVTVYDTLLTSVTDTLVINALITGINPPNNLNTLKVFPNPASTHITIDYGNFNAMSGYTLKIINSVGQTVFTTPINQQTSYIDLSTWTGNGIYFVQLIDPQNNTIENRKIVIQ
jgi:hypothetical protein